MRTMEVKTYKYEELLEDAQEVAREWWREGALTYEWWECVYEDAKTIGALMGIDISNIYFSGFSSQGDGAMFEGSYSYKKDSVKAVKEYAPQDAELHGIAETLFDIQRKCFYNLSVSIKHRGHYYHENCIEYDIYHNDEYSYSLPEGADEIIEPLKDFMRWIYSTLEKQNDYILSDENAAESITINEYDFTEDGKRYSY